MKQTPSRVGQKSSSTTEPTPIEDLSREHALAARLLLAYEAGLGMPIGAETNARLNTAAGRPQMKELMTDAILRTASESGSSAGLDALRPHILAYVNMLRPHAAHEETILYPALRTIASADQIDDLQQTFAAAEKKRLGAGGFTGMVAKVANLERSLNIHALAMFTLQITGDQTTTATERQ